MALHRVPSLAQFAWQPPVLATQATPPASPAKGDRYIVASSPTGAWTGYATYIATYDGSAWIFDLPSEGWRAYDINADGDKLFNGTSWQAATTGGGLGYALSLTAANLGTISDGGTYYFGNKAPLAPSASQGQARVYVPKAGTIKAASVEAYFGTAGSDESVSVYIRKNSTTDYLIQAAGIDANQGVWLNGSLNISMAAGDYFEIKVVCPTFMTNPANGRFSGSIYIE